MLKSMTGFSRIEKEKDGKRLFFEARSLNNRFLEINIRIPKIDYMAEKFIRERVKAYVKRGKIDIVVKTEKVALQAVPKINEENLNRYIEIAKILKKKYGIKGDLRLEHLLYFKDLFAYEEENLFDESLIFEGIEELLQRLDEERRKEGMIIEEDLKKRLERIDSFLREIEERSSFSLEDFGRRLKEKVRTVVDNLDEQRLLQEICLFSERVDITEEIVRLKGHIGNFRSSMETPSSGRKLDFLIQEMLREANTIASKSQDFFINERVVNIKVEIEKMREEVQNVE